MPPAPESLETCASIWHGAPVFGGPEDRGSAPGGFLVRAVLAFALSSVALPALAGDFLDTRVTFSFADNDVTKGPEESARGSPSIPNFTPNLNNRLFYDDYERRDTGLENLTHVALYLHEPGFFEGLDTEAGFVLRAEMLTAGSSAGGVALSDDGTYIKLTQGSGESSKLSLTAFPISAHRMALGYSYDISWGGRDIFKSRLSPGVKLQFDTEGAYGFLGFKTALVPQRKSDGTIEQDTVWGVMGGAGLDVVDELRLEFGAGYFRRGIIDKPELLVPEGNRFKTAPWDAFGGSAQVVYHVGVPIGIPIDFRLYKNDPLKRQDFFKPETYDGGTSFLVQAEASVLGQTLQDPERPSSTVIQPAMAADLAARVKVGFLRLHALAVYRSLSFLRFNVPSAPPFTDFPDGIEALPEVFAYAGVDYYLEELHLTPGFSLGVQRPAHITTAPNVSNNPQSLEEQTIIFRNETDDVDILNPGDEVKLIFASKLTVRWDLAESVGLVGEGQFSYDENRRILAQDVFGVASRVKADPEIIGFNVMLQARF